MRDVLKKLVVFVLVLSISISGSGMASSAAPTGSPGISDIDKNWAKAQIEALSRAGIVTGYADGTYRPYANITREEVALILAKHMGSSNGLKSKFSDVKGRYSESAIAALTESNIITGYSDGKFRPKNNITREEFCAIIYRYLSKFGQINYGHYENSFKDNVSEWAKEYVGTLVNMGILRGMPDGTFRGKTMIDRASAANLIVKMDRHMLVQRVDHSSLVYETNKGAFSKELFEKSDGKEKDSKKNQDAPKGVLMAASTKWDSIGTFVFIKESDANLESVKSKVYEGLSDEAKKAVYFGQTFEDPNLVLVLDTAGNLKSDYKYDLPEGKAGIYVDNANNELELFDKKNPPAGYSGKILVFAGEQKSDKLFTAQYMIGLPKNKAHFGVGAIANTKLIAGLNFISKDTEIEGLNGSAISLTKKEDLNLVIDGNTFTFDGEKRTMARAVTGLSMNGNITIKNNVFSGKNPDKRRASTENYGLINSMSRSERGLELKIHDNKFLDIKSAAINLTIGEKKEKIDIYNNEINHVEDDGIKLSIFPLEYPKKHDINVRDNNIRNYGTGEYMAYSQGGAGALAPSNDNEAGIELSYTGPVFGTYVNGKWVSKDTELAEMISNSNSVMSAQEDKMNDNVVDPTPVKVGMKGRFIDTKEKINSGSPIIKDHFFVITKDENGDVTFGQNKEEPTAPVVVAGLFITGTGSGVVKLPPTLIVNGDLIVDLPRGSLQNHAVIKGNKIIKAQSEVLNDAKFKLSVDKFTRGEAPAEGIEILVSDVKNDKGIGVDKNTTVFQDVSVFVNGVKLEKADFDVEQGSDKITVKKHVADKMKGNVNIVAEFEDKKNGVSKVISGNLKIEVIDESKADFSFSKTKFYHMNPDGEEIQIKVENIKNKKGISVSAADSKLKASFERYGRKVDDNFIRVDDENDVIYLKKELLEGLSATEYLHDLNQSPGVLLTYTVTVWDEANGIGEISKDVKLDIPDKSYASFEFAKGLTFTQGEAPDEGIKVYVKDILNTKGERVSAAKSVLKGNVNIEPFPVNRDKTDDSEVILDPNYQGEFGREIFNPKYMKIDDVNDTITLTKEYLNKMKTDSESSTEAGIKTFTFVYNDDSAKVSMRTVKVPLHIKKKEVPRSDKTEIAFKEATFRIQEKNIVSNGKKLDETVPVCDLLKEVIKVNPRQRVLVINASGDVKKSYEALSKGDKVKVIAENSVANVEYSIVFGEQRVPKLFESLNNAIVLSHDMAIMKVKKGIKVRELLDAIKTTAGFKAEVVGTSPDGAEYVVTPDSDVANDHKLRVLGDNQKYYFTIRVAAKKAARVLMVGNYDYAGEKLDLVGPKNDLKMMEAVFRGNRLWGEKTISPIIKENLRKKEFLEAIHLAFQDAADDDVSYIYYSGHGNNVEGMSYICTVDEKLLPDGKHDPTGWISVNELKRELDKVPGTKVLILDCCNAGGFIGKKAIDSVTSPTKKVNSSSTSEMFVRDVQSTFAKNQYNADVSYLTDNEYKVIAASSENEYSYEDKKEGLGKFTKQLAIAAGLNDSQMVGDSNGDKKLSIKEAYDFLMQNVVSISHIQVYPYMDDYAIFEDVHIAALSNDTGIDSDRYNVNLRKDSKGRWVGSITAKAGDYIDGEMTVADFISKFTKRHDAQILSVIKRVGSDFVSMESTEKLGKDGLFLQVTAENGDISRYPFRPKIVVPVTPETDTDINVNDPDIELMKSVSYMIKLKKEMTVSEFIGKIQKVNPGQTLDVYSKKKIVKSGSDKMEMLDYLQVTAADGKTTRRVNITLSISNPGTGAAGPVPDFGGAFVIEGDKIVSGTKEITESMKVEDFLKSIKNVVELSGKADSIKVYNKNANVASPFTMPKKPGDNLEKGDRLVIKWFAFPKPLPPTIYNIEVK